MSLRIGLDFDNTLAGYDAVFTQAAREHGLDNLGPQSTKQDVRALCRSQVDGEKLWMKLQGRVYGALMHHARLISGAAEFLSRCQLERAQVFIVSHKTQYGHFDSERVNLREAAKNWMKEQGFFELSGFCLSQDDVYFEDDRAAKVKRIASLGCQYFVDDLEEVFREPGFPSETRRLLFTDGRKVEAGPYEPMPTWKSIGEAIFAR